MKYFKLAMSDTESRWINLAQVSRVTLASEAAHGAPILAIFFADARDDGKLEIPGTTPQNREVIKDLTSVLDALSG